ncbi:MAG TPA: Xaa-Pro peptidase family protein [Acidimicrobiales bacterium]|nr:Xaa-Pro peptidase family protein [Acidimicrobiales bacterium]
MIPSTPDLGRMRRERGARLRSAMTDKGVDALILLGNANVSYATGSSWPLSDAGRANVERPVAVVLADDDVPHLFTPFRDEAAVELGLDDDHLHGPTYLDYEEGIEAFAKALAGVVAPTATVAVDDLTGAMHAGHDLLFSEWPPRSASEVMGPARFVKTPDELACIRHGLWITEQAMAEVQAQLAPGMRQTDLTATFLHRVFELGAEANVLDPIWQVMPDHQADLPWTTHGDIACPLLSTERALEQGDLLWVDSGIEYAGYHSDFGRTWVVGAEPTDRQQAQFEKWRAISDAVVAVTRAGATGADLTAAAMAVCDGERPWMAHFYVGHGLGLDSAESPYVGTDLGDDYDKRLVLEAGTIVVIEPVVWDEGHSGYRSENVFVVTDDGCQNLSDYPYAPYGD